MQDFKMVVADHKLTVQVYAESASLPRGIWLVPSVPAGTGRDLSPRTLLKGAGGPEPGLPTVSSALLGFGMRT